MQITIALGSPRPNGHTAQLLRYVTEGIRQLKKPVNVEEVFLNNLTIRGCQSCNACMNKKGIPGCILPDDMQPLYEQVLSTDVLVIASPIYMWHLSAQTKLFLDRLYCMYKYGENACNLMAGKTMAAVFTMGGDAYEGSEAANSLMKFAQYFQMGFSGVLFADYADPKRIHTEASAQRARAFGTALARYPISL